MIAYALGVVVGFTLGMTAAYVVITRGDRLP